MFAGVEGETAKTRPAQRCVTITAGTEEQCEVLAGNQQARRPRIYKGDVRAAGCQAQSFRGVVYGRGRRISPDVMPGWRPPGRMRREQ
jgi:hypothetical protein